MVEKRELLANLKSRLTTKNKFLSFESAWCPPQRNPSTRSARSGQVEPLPRTQRGAGSILESDQHQLLNFFFVSGWCPRQDSNLYHEIRNPTFYPLSGGAGSGLTG